MKQVKVDCTDTSDFEPPSDGQPQIVSVIFTESIASTLNIRTQHLQDIEENSDKSKICVLVEGFEKCNRSLSDSNLPVNDNVALFRIVPMEESSTSFDGMDDLSEICQDDSNNENETKSKFFLMQQCVNTQSLMAICSLAHDGNLIVDADKIFVAVKNTEQPLRSSSWINMCRICHGTDSVEELIGPCRCKGSIALAHLSCLERWLRESETSRCELCLHHYEIKREPKYNIIKSIYVWMTTPGAHRNDIIDDIIYFSLYTPAAFLSTYILMMVGECAAKNSEITNADHTHFIMFLAAAGIAAIDFTYSSWLMMRLQYHMTVWRSWYRDNCCLTINLPFRKRRRRCANVEQTESQIMS